jgi:hypothetical protein
MPAAARRRSTYDIMWREAIMELLDQLEAESPEDASLAPKARPPPFGMQLHAARMEPQAPCMQAHARPAPPACAGRMCGSRDQCPRQSVEWIMQIAWQWAAACGQCCCHAIHTIPIPVAPRLPSRTQDLAEWAVIYIHYLQIFRRLEVAYDQVVHPQKRQDIRRALEACMGRMLEVRHWMVREPRSQQQRKRQWAACSGLPAAGSRKREWQRQQAVAAGSEQMAAATAAAAAASARRQRQRQHDEAAAATTPSKHLTTQGTAPSSQRRPAAALAAARPRARRRTARFAHSGPASLCATAPGCPISRLARARACTSPPSRTRPRAPRGADQ